MHLYGAIIACETAFWLILVLALGVRYLLHRRQLSRWLLLSLPALDLLLLVFAALDLRSGSPATVAHGLATVYVGFTLAFGSIVIARADRQFACWFAHGPRPSSPPSHGWAAIRHEAMLWIRCGVAWALAIGLLAGLSIYASNADLAQKLSAWLQFAAISIAAWFIFGPLWSLIFCR